MSKFFYVLMLLLAVVVVRAQGDGKIKVPSIFGDNMVLQRNIKVPIWGWARTGEKVSIIFQNKTFETSAGSDGKWFAQLSRYKAGGPYEMVIKGNGEQLHFGNILIGDVWVVSGQSNMEFGIQTERHGAEAIEKATDTLMHFFFVPFAFSLRTQENISRTGDDSPNGKWVVCSPQMMGDPKWAWHGFSAAGYYFAWQIRQRQGCPVGMIATYKGGTPAQAWISEAGLRQPPAFEKYVSAHELLVKNYEKDKAAGEGGYSAPSNLYNAMVAPIAGYGIKGVLWYQGESNGDKLIDAIGYKDLFPRLISDWRVNWKQAGLPFIFVQLPGFRAPAKSPAEGNWPWVREAQLKTSSLRRTGMVVTIDIGETGNIHPTNKEDVGLRLALVARHLVYGEKIVYSGPVFKSMKVEGNKIRLRFNDMGGGLTVGRGDSSLLKGFGIAGDDQQFVWAKAVIEGSTIVVTSDEVSHPAAVRYNWADNPPGNLYNREGLPASPFRTDDWAPR